MSEIENHTHRVTWRSIPGINRAAGDYGEFLDTLDVSAAYYQRDEGMIVFKQAGGAIVFTIAESHLETIRVLGDLNTKATGGHITVNVAGSVATEDEIVDSVRLGTRNQWPRSA